MAAVASKTPVRAYGPAQLPSSSATRYTVPAGRIAVLRHIHVINPTAGAVTVTVSIGTDATGTRLFSGKSLAAGAEYDHLGYWVLGPGEVLQANASSGSSLVMTVFGDEYGTFPDNGGNARDQFQASNDSTSSVTVATITADASTPHTKGAWVELVASTAFRARRITVEAFGVGSSGAGTSTLLEVGVGAAAAEVVKIPNILHGGTLSISGMPCRYEFELDIPAGSRIAMRCQALVLSQQVSVSCRLFASGGVSDSPSSVTTYGIALATSIGTIPGTPGAINTEGSWTQITAGTSEDHGAMSVSIAGSASNTVTASSGLLDIGYGGAGSEVVLIPNIPWSAANTEDIRVLIPAISRVNLPSGTRLAVRIQATSITGNFRPTAAVHCWGALVT